VHQILGRAYYIPVDDIPPLRLPRGFYAMDTDPTINQLGEDGDALNQLTGEGLFRYRKGYCP
jgi:hypothetical protein